MQSTFFMNDHIHFETKDLWMGMDSIFYHGNTLLFIRNVPNTRWCSLVWILVYLICLQQLYAIPI